MAEIMKSMLCLVVFFASAVAFAGEPFIWDGKSPDSEFRTSAQSIAVTPGQPLCFDITWKKHEWNFGSAAHLRIKWETAAGRQIGITAFNSKFTEIPGASNYPCVESGAKSAIGKDILVRAYQKVPKDARFARVGFLFYGNPCRISLEDVKVSKVDVKEKPWMRRQPDMPQIKYGPVPYTDAQVAIALKSRPRAMPKILQEGDRIELEVNGERIFPGIRHLNRRDPMRGIREFSKIGFRIFNTYLYVGESTYNGESGFREPQLLKEDGSYDIALLERKVYEVLREDTNAYVVLVCKISATESWKRANLSELECNTKGEYRIFDTWKFSKDYSKTYPETPGKGPVPSVFSRKFPDDVSVSFAEALRRFEKTDASKAVIGVYVTGGDDSQFRLQTDPWTSGIAPRAFRAFLAEKYRTDAALAAAWGMPNAKISEAEVPSEADLYPDCEYVSIKPSPASDFRECCSYAVARMNSGFRAGVKMGAPRLLAGGYSCASTLGGDDGRGRHALSMMMNDPNTDFIIWLPGYSRRRDEITVPIGMEAYNGSMVLHRKLMIAEMDVRYPYGKYLQSGIYKSDRWQETHDDSTFSNFLKYFAAASFAWGGTVHAYPLANNWYDYPGAMEAWRKVVDIVRHSYGKNYGSNRIAAFFDDRSTDFISWKLFTEGWMCPGARNRQLADVLWRVGARFDHYAIEDVMNEEFAVSAPKVLLINDASSLKPQKIADIRRRYGKGGRVLLWVGNPGFHSGAELDEISQTFGIGISTNNCRKPIIATAFDDPLCRDVKGFWNETAPGLVRRFPMSYEFECRNGWTPIAGFADSGKCAAAVRRAKGFTEVVVGAPGSVTPQFLRNACREAGFAAALETDDFYIEGGGLIVVGGCVRDGVRRIRMPQGTVSLKCLTGQTVRYPEKGFLEVDIKCGEAAIFVQPKQ